MPIDRAGTTSSLIAALRADITRRSERNRREAADDTATSHRDTAALRRELVEIVRATPQADPQVDEAIQRRVIEAVLRWEFGAERTGPTVSPMMLEHLARTLQSDPRHGEQFARLVRELQQR